jgi:hypothetical protein
VSAVLTSAPWLSHLAADRAPPALGWWQLAPGWWLVIFLSLVALEVGLRWHRQRRTPTARWQRAARREWARLHALSQSGADDPTIARGVQQLLRRYAVARFGRDAVAPLSGDAWIAFVVRHGGADWSGDTGRLLLRCAYGGHTAACAAADRARWLSGARGFIKKARA